MATQLFRAAEAQIPGLDDQIASGDFGSLKEWLRANVHEVGSMHTCPDDLLMAVTGQPLNTRLYTDYLIDKYSKLYEL